MRSRAARGASTRLFRTSSGTGSTGSSPPFWQISAIPRCAKKYDERRDVWQGRVSRDYRFYFTIEGDTYRILSIIPHPK